MNKKVNHSIITARQAADLNYKQILMLAVENKLIQWPIMNTPASGQQINSFLSNKESF